MLRVLCIDMRIWQLLFFFFKQKTAYEMRISDWSSDVCSSDLGQTREVLAAPKHPYTAKLVGSLPRPGDGGATGGGGDVLLSIEQAVVEYRGKPGLFGAGAPKRVIDGVDIAVRSGEIVAPVGAQGPGTQESGRARCRERGVQCVLRSVGPGGLK